MNLARAVGLADVTIAKRPSLATGLVLLAASVWINLGSFHRLQNGDSIVPVLVSLERWTPFYWEQGRFGMLVPLLALPFRHPLANLIFQNILTCALGLAAFFLVARLFLRRRWFAVGALSCALFILLTSATTRFEYLGTPQPYGTSLGLALLGTVGLLSHDPRSPWAGAAGLAIAAALWVSPTSALFVVPALVAEGALVRQYPKRRLVAALAWVCLGFAAAEALSRVLGESHSIAAPDSWWRTIVVMARNAFRAYLGEGLAVLMAAGLLVGARIIGGGPSSRKRLLDAGVVTVGALAAIIGMAVVGRVAEDPSERYALTGIVPLIVAAVAVCGEAARSVAGWRLRFARPTVGLLALTVSIVLAYGPPSLATVRHDVDRLLGAYTQSLIDTRTTHFVGSYWKVWPAVFHFNLTLYERGSDLRLWGVTHRSRPTAESWLNLREWRLAAPADEAEILWWVRGYGLPFTEPVLVHGNVLMLRFIDGERAPSGFPVPQRFVPGMERE